MSKVSVIIPSRNEKYLTRTIDDIFTKATGEIEVITVIDGPSDYPLPAAGPAVRLIVNPYPVGIRAAINQAVAAATGRYLLKIDAHCALAKGFDEVLQHDCQNNWVVIPRVYPLDVDVWRPIRNTPPWDYFFLSCPWKNVRHSNRFMMKDCRWETRSQTRKKMLIDDQMTFSGCCWFMPTEYFRNRIGGLNTTDFGEFAEHQEIGLKTWLGGGRVIVNKKTWCAHFGQKFDRGYSLSKTRIYRSHEAVAKYWANNHWEGRVHDFAWLVDKFWPLPTRHDPTRDQAYYWPDNWKDYYNDTNDEGQLVRLALKYGSDKCPQIHHFYTEYYAAIFKGKRHDIKKVLEIGVGHPGCMTHSPNYHLGASLYMWQGFFPNAQVYGADILPELVFTDERIQTFLCDQTDKAGLVELIRQIGPDIDLVIDDGSHIPEDQVFTCLTLMPLLDENVIYVIEDVVDRNIVRFLKGYHTHVIRKSKMASIYDRLVEVTNIPPDHS